jgi:hypothetical protein
MGGTPSARRDHMVCVKLPNGQELEIEPHIFTKILSMSQSNLERLKKAEGFLPSAEDQALKTIFEIKFLDSSLI